MVIVLKNELEKMNELLCELSDFIEGDDELYGIVTHYEHCTDHPKQLLIAIQGVQEKFNRIWDLWEIWDKRQNVTEPSITDKDNL
jgi:hypothetical protein